MDRCAALPRAAVVARLRAAGCVFADDEADLLLVETTDAADLERSLVARENGVPLEQVLGWAEFCGRRVRLLPGVFVPRRRTALLATEAVRRTRTGSVVVDLCCGSGAVALVVAAEVPGAEVHAADVDRVAVRCAEDNLAGLGAGLHLGDLYDALPGVLLAGIDVITANAPYVPTAAISAMPIEARSHEPMLALDGGPDGLDVQRRVIAGAPLWLRPGGHLLVETSDRQVEVTSALMEEAGLSVSVVSSGPLDATVAVGSLPSSSVAASSPRQRRSGARAFDEGVASMRPAPTSRRPP